MFADSQSDGRVPVAKDCVKITCNTGDSSSAQCFNI